MQPRHDVGCISDYPGFSTLADLPLWFQLKTELRDLVHPSGEEQGNDLDFHVFSMQELKFQRQTLVLAPGEMIGFLLHSWGPFLTVTFWAVCWLLWHSEMGNLGNLLWC